MITEVIQIYLLLFLGVRNNPPEATKCQRGALANFIAGRTAIVASIRIVCWKLSYSLGRNSPR